MGKAPGANAEGSEEKRGEESTGELESIGIHNLDSNYGNSYSFIFTFYSLYFPFYPCVSPG